MTLQYCPCMLVGRQAECHQIDALLAAARAGTSGLLVIQGEAGIGKSALLEYARARARGMNQLRMQGVESEARLAFAGLTELLRPVLHLLDDLPVAQADAMRSALALRTEPAGPLAVRVALLTLLGSMAAVKPVLVTVDDAQWLDESSLAALGFAVRRLAIERVAVVVAGRDQTPRIHGCTPDCRITVEGLSDDEARELLVARSGLDPHAADGLIRLAAGNPLALLELPTVLGSQPPTSGVEPPPVGPRVEEAFRQRLDRLAAPTRLAVAVVAADGVAHLGEVLRAFDTLGVAADALQPAEDLGLVTVEAGRVSLRHPLLRSVAYHAQPAPERRRVHAALATAVDGPVHVERRTWHRAAAALGPDEAVASALDEVASAAERRGDLPATAHGYARGASLTPDNDARARRLLASADAWLAGGYWDLSLDQLEEARAHAVDPLLRADIAASTGQLETYRSGPETGQRILVDAADDIEAIDPERATRLLVYAVNDAVFAADVHRAVELARRAEACGARAGGLNIVAGGMARIEAGLLAGDPSVPDAVAPLAALAEQVLSSDLEHAEHVVNLVAFADFLLESWARADRMLDVLIRRARDTGRLFLLAPALTIRGELDFRRGRWSDAYDTVTTEVWENPLGLPGVGAWLYAVQARVEAGLGLDGDAHEHGEAAIEVATRTGTDAVAAWARAALGFLELGRGRPAAAVEHLEKTATTMQRGGVGEPGIVWFAGDLIEAQWRLGNVGAARRHLETLRRQADSTGRTWALAVAARSAGILAHGSDEAEVAFAEALRWHDRLDTPFERARTLLRQGERRASDGRADAEPPLRDALATFDALHAVHWTAQTRKLLGGAGTEVPALTRQERQVAAVVGQGVTNREAAEQLFLSVRTIDFHLRNIYRKLGVRSRTELALRIRSEAVDVGEP